ncbi:MAG: hypothetical protein FJ260_00870 [Planctomycetes bacterium]|nr:hypothetical protein [Planctomycetota bacterium]
MARLRPFAALAFAMLALAAAAAPPSWDARLSRFVDAARRRTLDACESRGIRLPKDFLDWIDRDPVLRTSVYGCRADPLPVLLGLRSLEIDLGEQAVRKDYPQLALAFAMQDSYAKRVPKAGTWNDADGAVPADTLPDVAPRKPLALEVPGDPRVRVDTKDPKRKLDRNDHVVNFLEDHAPVEVDVTAEELPPLEYDDKGVARPRGEPVKVTRKAVRPLAAADVIASAALQAEFNAYMQAHGDGTRVNCGNGAVAWNSTAAVGDGELRKRIAAAHELFHDAYRATGRMPAERDRAPTPAESMAWFMRNDRWRPPAAEGAQARWNWPRFPLNAPWPVLMMLAADDQPLREREEIWRRYAETGEARTYGEYIGDIAQQFDMQSARRLSPFAFSYGSIQMMWKDGGVCGTMGNIGARTERILGVPASTAGQPGHCAMVQMDCDRKSGVFRCKGEQYATGGDEVTIVHAGWNYDDTGGRRPMVFHQTIAWGVNAGLGSLVDTLAMRRAWDALPAEERADPRECREFLEAGLSRNPYAMAVAEAAVGAAPDAASAVALVDSLNAALDKAKVPADRKLYRDTVRDLAHARVLALPSPGSPEKSAALLADLTRQGCTNAQLLARCWRETSGEEGFVERCVKAAEDYLASPDRAKGRKAGEKLATQVKAWARTIKDRKVRELWAATVLKPFEGKEYLDLPGKRSIDPVVAELCKAAGRKVPPDAGAR